MTSLIPFVPHQLGERVPGGNLRFPRRCILADWLIVMLVAATFFSTQLSRLHERWRIEKSGAHTSHPLFWTKTDFKELPCDDTRSPASHDFDCPGLMVIYDWPEGKIVWRSDWNAAIAVPAGFCFADNRFYVNDSESAALFEVEVQPVFGRISRRISHPYFNDLHSVQHRSRGFLVTSSGLDAIVEVDRRGRLLFEWWAAEHGYIETPAGVTRASSGRGLDHRATYYHTRFHATHVNSAVVQDADERFLLALLFQQGTLVQIDRSVPNRGPRVILDNLIRPHGLECTPNGWLFCNTLGQELVLISFDFKTCERIPHPGKWLQDCTMLSNGNILVADVDEHTIVEIRCPDRKIIRTVECDREWRLAELNEVPAGWAQYIDSYSSRSRL